MGFYANRVAYFAEKAGIVLTFALGAWRTIGGIAKGKPREITKGVTGIGTTLAGGVGGEAVGAAIGTLIFPGIGTVIGSFVGGVAGAITLNAAGEAIVDIVHDEFGNDVCDYCKEYSKKSKKEIRGTFNPQRTQEYK